MRMTITRVFSVLGDAVVSASTGMKEVAKWSAGVVAAVLAGVLVYWLTVGLGAH